MVEPFSASVLAYPVGLAVSNVIGKVIDITLYQPQVSQSRQDELYAQHEFRLEELKQQHEQSIISSLINSEIRINEQKIIEQLRASYSASANAAIRNAVREDANSPFFDGIETTHQNLKTLYEQTHLPIVLVSPFWDDSKNKAVGEQGGYVDFRTAFNTSYRQASWQYLASKQDGYFKRPLFQTDRDINYIYSVLSDIPVILIHGTIQGSHSPHQQVQRIHPQITFWNLFPDESFNYSQLGFLELKFFSLQLPIGKGNSPDIYKQIGEYSLGLQDTVGKYLTKAIGLLSSFYHLYHFETRPNLQQFKLENEKELEILSHQVYRFYDLLARNNHSKVNYYSLEKSVLSLKREVDEIKKKKEFTQDCDFDFNLDATEIRDWFTNQLDKMIKILEALQKGGVLKALVSSDFIEQLAEAKGKLQSSKSKLLIIGGFNTGKSTIINVLLGQRLLPMGATPTTAIPTFVKYGLQEKVIVYKKDGTQENLSIDVYQQKYTFNSKEVRKQIGINGLFKSHHEWLNFIDVDYAELYAPLEVLKRGTEFIDMPSLFLLDDRYHLEIFSYVEKKCDATIFVLDPLSNLSKTELISFLYFIENQNEMQSTPKLYLINKWDYMEKEINEEEIKEYKDSIANYLLSDIKIDYNYYDMTDDKIWGNKIFEVDARAALRNLQEGKSLDGTRFIELQKKLDMLTCERALQQLPQVVNIAGKIARDVVHQINLRMIYIDDINADKKLLQAFIDYINIQSEIINENYWNYESKKRI